MKLVTHFVYPPIPIRDFDWSAVDGDTYDGPGCLIGSGRTELAAMLDLIEQMDTLDEWPVSVAAKICPVFRAITGASGRAP